MYTLQLSNHLFVDINVGDLFIYRYDNTYKIVEVKNDFKPPLNEFTIEILSFYSKRHFIFKRDNGYYWWEEIKF